MSAAAGLGSASPDQFFDAPSTSWAHDIATAAESENALRDCASEGSEDDDDLENVVPDSCDIESDARDIFLDASEQNDIAFDDLHDTEDEAAGSCEDNEGEEGVDDLWRRYQRETLPHQRTTKAQALLLILTYIVAAGLFWTQIEGLLILLNLLGESVFP